MKLPYDRDSLLNQIALGLDPKFVFFWQPTPAPHSKGEEFLSQWFPSSFSVEGLDYGTAEQYMMAEKAALFGDDQIRSRILAESNPAHALQRLLRRK